MGEFMMFLNWMVVAFISWLQIGGLIRDFKIEGWHSLVNPFLCSKCSVFISSFILTDWITASWMSLIWLIIIKLIEKRYGI